MTLRSLRLVILSCFSLAIVYSVPLEDNFELTIIHLNDFHARFEETSPESTPCKDENCIGGFSRVYTKVHELVQSQPNTIFLNAGDNFQGTIWYNAFRWNVTQHFMNKLPTDAYTLGNHEFDQKIAGIVPFIKALNAPTIVANIDDRYEPEIQGTYKKSTVIERGGHKIGIIGVIAKNTNELSSTEKLIFLDEVESVNKEAINLRENENCKIIIVLSHAGIEVDKKMAEVLVPNVNMIVGGHSHTLLYNGETPNHEQARGSYPEIVERENGRKVLIVQASAYTKYLGHITVLFNKNGDILNWKGNPVYLDASVPQDPKINEDINTWKAYIDEFANKIIGSTNVVLDNELCHQEECNFGNFFADAMVDYFVPKAEIGSWTYAAVALTNSGGIRTTLVKGNITFGDLLTSSPFENVIEAGDLKGIFIKEALEVSLNGTGPSFVDFFQVSGLQIVIDISQPVGSRVQSIKVKCRECDVPKFEDINLDSSYRVIVNSFLSKKGSGFPMISDNLNNKIVVEPDIIIFEKYLKKMSPVTTGLDGRITVLK